jgi:hypothetical protein
MAIELILLKLPPEVARRFVEDMKALQREPNPIKLTPASRPPGLSPAARSEAKAFPLKRKKVPAPG